MPHVCPRCRTNDLRVQATVAIVWDGVATDIDEWEMRELVASDGVIWPDADVSCNNEECEWSGVVKELRPSKE